MKTTSLELSKKLYKAFPEWKYGLDWTRFVNPSLDSEYTYRVAYDPLDDEEDFLFEMEELGSIPLYTSDYLLSKLPDYQGAMPLVLATSRIPFVDEPEYFAGYMSIYNNQSGIGESVYGITPAEALGLLALKLKEEGLL